MTAAASLAGFLAAHVFEGLGRHGHLPVHIAFRLGDGTRRVELVTDGHDYLHDEELARERLTRPPPGARSGVTAAHAASWFEDGGDVLDAAWLDLRDYSAPSARAAIVVPYVPSTRGRLRAHRPGLDECRGCDGFARADLLREFTDGIALHPGGARVWSAILDASR